MYINQSGVNQNSSNSLTNMNNKENAINDQQEGSITFAEQNRCK